jgi:hypothetical protein
MLLTDREKELLAFQARPSTKRYKAFPKSRLEARRKMEAIMDEKKINKDFQL